MIRFLFGSAIVLLSQALFASNPAIATEAYRLSAVTTTTVSSDQSVVKHVFTAKNTSGKPLPTSFTIMLQGTEVQSLKATAADGKKLESRTEKNGSATQAIVTLPKDKVANNKAWSFSIQYESEGGALFGGLRAALIPGLETNATVTAHTHTIAADLSLGLASTTGLKPTKTSIGVGQQLLTYTNAKGPVSDAVLLHFGQESVANIQFEATLRNTSWWWKDVTLTLPPDTNQQRVVLDSIDPKPSKVRIDRDGNVLALFTLRPRAQQIVTARATATILGSKYSIDGATPVATTDAQLVEHYTRSTDNWQPAGIDVSLDESANAAEVVQAVYEALVNRARQEVGQDQQSLSVAERNGSLQYADLLVGELRSRGVPARVVLGATVSTGKVLAQELQQHAWAEAYVAGVGWMTLDPWLGIYGSAFGSTDPLRVGLAVWGIEDNRPPVDLSVAAISFTDSEAPVRTISASVKGSKYMILPFMSVTTVHASQGQGSIVDNAIVRLDGENDIELGSQAPFQTSTVRTLALGMDSFASQSAAVGTVTSGEFTAWAEPASISVSYLPLIIIIFTVVSSVVIRIVWSRRRANKTGRMKSSTESLTLHNDATDQGIEEQDLIMNSLHALTMNHAPYPTDPHPTTSTPSAGHGTLPQAHEPTPTPDQPRRPRLIQ